MLVAVWVVHCCVYVCTLRDLFKVAVTALVVCLFDCLCSACFLVGLALGVWIYCILCFALGWLIGYLMLLDFAYACTNDCSLVCRFCFEDVVCYADQFVWNLFLFYFD